MHNPSLIIYAQQVKKVRYLQTEYFATSAKAKKSRLPEDYAQAKTLLHESKKAEKDLDAATACILSRKEAENG